MKELYDAFIRYVEHSLMFETAPDEILGFEEFCHNRFDIPLKDAEDWFYANADQLAA